MKFLKNVFLKGNLNTKKSKLRKFLKNLLGYTPSSIQLYSLALRHKSIVKKEDQYLDSNERLEFLGDAVLNSIISEYLYLKFPSQLEGGLSKMRSKLVNRSFLNKRGLNLRLNEVLEAEIGTSEKPKSIYGDALEALIGAIYMDKGYEEAKKFILFKMFGSDQEIKELLSQEIDYKSKLIEWAHKHDVSVNFKLIEIPGDERVYEAQLLINSSIKSKGKGLTKKEAEQNAARAHFVKS